MGLSYADERPADGHRGPVSRDAPRDHCGHRRRSTPVGVIDMSRGSSEANTPGRPHPTTPGTPKVVRESAADGFRAGGQPAPWTTTVERRALPSGTVSLGATPSGGSHGGSPSRHASVGRPPRLFVAAYPAETGGTRVPRRCRGTSLKTCPGRDLGRQPRPTPPDSPIPVQPQEP